MTTCEDIKAKRQHMCWTSAEAWGFAQEEICQKCLEKFKLQQAPPRKSKVVRFIKKGKIRGRTWLRKEA